MPTYRRPQLSQQGSPVPKRNLSHYTDSFIGTVYGYVIPKVEHFMKERGMTQKEFAKHIYVQPARMNRVLGGPENWTLRTIAKLLIGIGEDPRKMIAYLDRDHAREAGFSVTPEVEAPMAAADAKETVTHSKETVAEPSEPRADVKVRLRDYIKPSPSPAPPSVAMPPNAEQILRSLGLIEQSGLQTLRQRLVHEEALRSIMGVDQDIRQLTSRPEFDAAAKLAGEMQRSVATEFDAIAKFMAEFERSTSVAHEQAAELSKRFAEQLEHADRVTRGVAAGFEIPSWLRAGSFGAEEWPPSYWQGIQGIVDTVQQTARLPRDKKVAPTSHALTGVRDLNSPAEPSPMSQSRITGSPASFRSQPRPVGRRYGGESSARPVRATLQENVG